MIAGAPFVHLFTYGLPTHDSKGFRLQPTLVDLGPEAVFEGLFGLLEALLVLEGVQVGKHTHDLGEAMCLQQQRVHPYGWLHKPGIWGGWGGGGGGRRASMQSDVTKTSSVCTIRAPSCKQECECLTLVQMAGKPGIWSNKAPNGIEQTCDAVLAAHDQCWQPKGKVGRE